MKRIFIVIVLLVYSLLNAIDYNTASGNDVKPSQRDTLFYYHTNNDDQHWFGTDSWAVKFEFNEQFEDIDSLSFEAEGANIYIPGFSGSDSITVKLCRDSVGQPQIEPNNLLFSQTLQASEIQYQDWNYIPFSNTITDTTLWLVVDYPTNSSEQFISASATGGSQSYFWDNDQYLSMYNISYDSEFLFSLQGRIIFEGTDLDLVTVSWAGEFLPDGTIYPRFTVKNNSDVQVSGSYITPFLENPNTELELLHIADSTVCQQIDLPTLNANEIHYFDFTDTYMYRLLDIPSQYQFEAELYCETDSLTENNISEDEFHTFTDQSEFVLFENAVRLNDSYSNNLWLDQSTALEVENSLVLNYFSLLVDEPFFNDDAFSRFNYYNLFGIPATVINGGKKILGYSTNYLNQLTNFYNEALSQKTFISNDTCYASYNDLGDVAFTYEIENSSAEVFAEFINDLTLRIGVFENVENEPGIPDEINIPVFTYMITETDVVQLLNSTTIIDSINFNYNDDFSTITNNTDNCEVVLWLQNDETKEIFFTEKLPFTDFQPGLVSLNDDEIPNLEPEIKLFPNPCKIDQKMNISFSLPNTIEYAELKIYNIKGQIVKTIFQESTSQNVVFVWNGKNEEEKPVSSGIYLMQINSKADGENHTHHRKGLLIR